MTFIDLFAGVGGARRGMELAGHKCIGFCEWDKYAAASYISMHLITDEQRQRLAEMPLKKRQKEILKDEYRNGEWYRSDIRYVRADDVPRADCWCFGAPCLVAGTLITTISGMIPIEKVRVYQMGQCVNKAYSCAYSIHYDHRPKTHVINNRIVNQKDIWGLVFRKNTCKTLGEMVDGVLWQPLRSISYDAERTEYVYNLEVEDEHSYTANNMGLHNCQDFSVAGKRAGLDGDRSSLVREVFRIIRETREENRPEWLVYENVKGMLSSNRGFDYLTLLLEMDELGYDIEWQIFNSKYHSVPQNRERVYTVGHLRRYGERKVFPLRGADEEDNICKVEQIAQQNSTHRKNPNQYRVYDSKGLSPCLNKMDGGGREPHISMCIPVLTPDRAEKRQNGRRFKDNGDEAFTLTAQDRHGVAIGGIYTQVSEKFQRGALTNTARANKANKHDNGVMLEYRNKKADIPVVWYEKYKCYIAIRKFTPRECFRLQGWTDDYFDKAQFVNSDSQLYKQAGNGITVTVMEDIAKALKEIENG